MISLKNRFTAVLILLFIFSPFVLAETPAPTLSVTTYDQLVQAIRKTRQASEQRIETAVEQEKVREAWETGKLIDEHILLHKERAQYGEQVLVKLAKDLESSETEMRYMLQFARAYPIHRPADELSWSHYQSLLAINDPVEREAVIKEAVKNKWNRQQVRDEVRKRQPQAKIKSEKLAAINPGKINTYRIVKAGHGVYKGELVVDLGFSSYYKPGQGLKLAEGDLVQVTQKGNLYTLTQAPDLTADDLYTYQAEVIQVVDGDTFHASIDLGFGFTMTQRVRLQRVDAAEILTREGKDAKAALEKLLSKNKGQIVIKSAELDQHGRPLAIVWAGDTLVDQALLEKDLAAKVQA